MTVVAVVFVLATLAVGLDRPWLAFSLTQAVGLTWVIVGRSRRLGEPGDPEGHPTSA